jgi:2'-5' RNA ligase
MSNWFLAFPLDEHVGLELPRPSSGVSLLSTADLHLTLAFLGPVGEERALRAAALLFEALARERCESFPCSFDHLEPLGPAERFSVLATTLSEGHLRAVELLSRHRDAACDAASAPRDPRPPLPHVTLARIARSATHSQRADALAWSRSVDLRSARAHLRRIALFTASERPSSDRYRIVLAAPLALQSSPSSGS